jgi:alkylation response protein AidB-like acyl-CoA dehydrogenase
MIPDMNFGFTEEQELLRSEVRKFLDARCPIEQVRALMETEPGYSVELWGSLAELGWSGLTIPEVHGGAGLGWVDFVVLLEERRSLFRRPVNHAAAAAILTRQRRAEVALAAGNRGR